MRVLSTYLLLLLLLLQHQQHNVQADSTVIASSKLQACVQDGSSQTGTLTCGQELVVTLAVESGTNLQTQVLQFTVPCINSPDGNCPCKCNYATDPTCTCRDISDPVNVTLTKTAVYATYPLMYVQTFNYKPVEEIILVGGNNAVSSCEAGSLSNAPTCGWFYDVNGNRIQNSQGFCCSCSLSSTWQSSVGSGSTQGTRANLDCDIFSSGLFLHGVPGSAQCLRYDPLYYGGYMIQESALDFTINVTVDSPTGPDGATQTQVLALDPSTPLALSADRTVSAHLLGDLATYTALPDVTNSYLMIPQSQGMSPQQILTSNLDTWMIVPPTMVTVNNPTQCNMIGTNFTAFNNQPNACNLYPQSCLANQLKDLYTADEARILAGHTPEYFVTRYGGGNNGGRQIFKSNLSNPNSALVLALPLTDISNSVVTLAVKADNLTLITNSCPGKILSAKLCAYSDVSCGGFDALTDKGYMQVAVQNLGYIDASFYITVSNCSAGINSVDAQSVDIAALGTQNLTFALTADSNQFQPNNTCTIGLQDSQGDVTASSVVSFYTNATVYDPTPANPTINATVTGAAKGVQDPKSCALLCRQWYNLPCFLLRHCWLGALKLAGIIIGALALVGLLYAGIMRGWYIRMFVSCLSCLGGKKTNSTVPTGGTRKTNAADEESTENALFRLIGQFATTRPSMFGSMGGSPQEAGGSQALVAALSPLQLSSTQQQQQQYPLMQNHVMTVNPLAPEAFLSGGSTQQGFCQTGSSAGSDQPLLPSASGLSQSQLLALTLQQQQIQQVQQQAVQSQQTQQAVQQQQHQLQLQQQSTLQQMQQGRQLKQTLSQMPQQNNLQMPLQMMPATMPPPVAPAPQVQMHGLFPQGTYAPRPIPPGRSIPPGPPAKAQGGLSQQQLLLMFRQQQAAMQATSGGPSSSSHLPRPDFAMRPAAALTPRPQPAAELQQRGAAGTASLGQPGASAQQQMSAAGMQQGGYPAGLQTVVTPPPLHPQMRGMFPAGTYVKRPLQTPPS